MPTGRYVLQNSVGKNAWGAHVGLLPEETAVPPDVSARWAATNRRVLAGETIRAETCYIRGGEAVHVEEFLAPVRDAAGTIWGLVGVNLDIGERRRAEAAAAGQRGPVAHGDREPAVRLLDLRRGRSLHHEQRHLPVALGQPYRADRRTRAT